MPLYRYNSIMQAIIYTRVSTPDQAEGLSPEMQEHKGRQWCELHGHTVAGVYCDAGRSGRRADNRPELQAALAQCGQGTALVVYSLSRLARSVQDAAAIVARLDRAGADFVSITEAFDTTSAAGRLVFNLMASVAQFESEINGERTSDSMQAAKRLGLQYTRLAPYGYRHCNGRLVAVKAEQAIIAKVHSFRHEGISLRAIAEQLNSQGIKTKQGGKWHAASVKRALSNMIEA
jgi:site-specific DNA recombinase